MNARNAIFSSLGFVLAAGLILSACTKKDAPSSTASPAGEYALVSVDGNDVPATVTHQGAAVQVREGTFILNADGTCSSRTVFSPPGGNEIVRDVDATYTKDGSTLTMQWKGAGVTTGTLQGNKFTMDNEGMEFVYEK